MSTRDKKLHLPLKSQPIIRQAGLGEHGLRKKETFCRPDEWALHLYFWAGRLQFGGDEFEINSHDLGITPPNTPLTWHFPLESCRHYFIHFTFAESEASTDEYPLPVLASLRQRFDSTRKQFEEILRWSQSNQTRANVALWDLLWKMTDHEHSVRQSLRVRPGAVETALGIIENELDHKLNAKSLAARVALSYTQLNRLFKEHLDTTLSNYISAERLNRSRYLLLETNLPIKAIAEQVGVPDIQRFNKFIRLHTGLAPRKFREANQIDPSPKPQLRR